MAKFDLNKLISRQSADLFQLGPLELHLLGWISSQGENTIYGLEKMAIEHNRKAQEKSQHPMRTSHATIFRTIKELVDHGYIEISREEAYRTGQNKKYYAVSTKGWLASLASVSIDQTNNVKSLYPIVAQLTENTELQRITMLFLKNQLCQWLQFHVANGLILSHLVDANMYRVHSGSYVSGNEILFTSSKLSMTTEELHNQELLQILGETIKSLRGHHTDARNLLHALEGLNLVLGTKLIALLSQHNALGVALLVDIYYNLIERAHSTLLDDRGCPIRLATVAIEMDLHDGSFKEVPGTEKSARAEGTDEDLQVGLEVLRARLWGESYLENYGPLPEKEIVELYDSTVDSMLA